MTTLWQWQKETPIPPFGRGLYYQNTEHKLEIYAIWNTASLPLLIKSRKDYTKVWEEEGDNIIDEELKECFYGQWAAHQFLWQ